MYFTPRNSCLDSLQPSLRLKILAALGLGCPCCASAHARSPRNYSPTVDSRTLFDAVFLTRDGWTILHKALAGMWQQALPVGFQYSEQNPCILAPFHREQYFLSPPRQKFYPPDTPQMLLPPRSSPAAHISSTTLRRLHNVHPPVVLRNGPGDKERQNRIEAQFLSFFSSTGCYIV